MTITIEVETQVHFDFDYKKLAETIILYVLDRQGFPYEAEIGLTLTDNVTIHEINREHRQVDSPTDVLSFPLLTYERPGDFSILEEDTAENTWNFNPDTGEVLLGDIIISAEKVVEQATAYGHSKQREFAFLIVHSMLHLFGYDHMTEEDARLMEPLQRQILEELDISR